MSWGTQRPFRVPHWLFLLDVLLHQLGDDFVLLGQLGLQLLDPVVLGRFGPSLAGRAVERLLGLVQHLVDPGVNLPGLDPNSSARSQTGSLPLTCRRTISAFCWSVNVCVFWTWNDSLGVMLTLSESNSSSLEARQWDNQF